MLYLLRDLLFHESQDIRCFPLLSVLEGKFTISANDKIKYKLYKLFPWPDLKLQNYAFKSQNESVMTEMKATEQYFPVLLFITLYKMVLTLESVDEILKCDHPTESY